MLENLSLMLIPKEKNPKAHLNLHNKSHKKSKKSRKNRLSPSPNKQFERKKDSKKSQQNNKRKMPLSLNQSSHQDKENKLESPFQDLGKELLKD